MEVQKRRDPETGMGLIIIGGFIFAVIIIAMIIF
jgi:hypothetical protein